MSPDKHGDCREWQEPYGSWEWSIHIKWDGYLVLLRPWQNKLCTPVWFLCSLLRGHQVERIRYRNLWRVYATKLGKWTRIRKYPSVQFESTLQWNISTAPWKCGRFSYNSWRISLKMTQNIHHEKNSLLLALFSAYRSPKLRLFSFIWMKFFF